jgi:chromate reductase, NAD(P)H dehydrogenase (quinone)
LLPPNILGQVAQFMHLHLLRALLGCRGKFRLHQGNTMSHHVLVIVGSLRKESFSLKIAHALAKLAPASLTLEVITPHGISFFNQDLEANPPADWLAFREKIQKSDGIIFVTPEYNRAIPGVLKNAIDVGSRPYGKSSFLGKPTGIISNSPGPLGGVNAAKSLQNILPGICGTIMGQPETYLTAIGDAFDDKGNLIKEPLQKVLQQYIDAFAAFVQRQSA